MWATPLAEALESCRLNLVRPRILPMVNPVADATAFRSEASPSIAGVPSLIAVGGYVEVFIGAVGNIEELYDRVRLLSMESVSVSTRRCRGGASSVCGTKLAFWKNGGGWEASGGLSEPNDPLSTAP